LSEYEKRIRGPRNMNSELKAADVCVHGPSSYCWTFFFSSEKRKIQHQLYSRVPWDAPLLTANLLQPTAMVCQVMRGMAAMAED
jgi:hypothetical protein